MKSLKNTLPVVLLILFELAFGILLLIGPKQLTRTVLLCFGIVLLILGLIYLIRFLRERKQPEKSNYLNLPFAIISLAGALFCLIYGILAAEPDKEGIATFIYAAIFIVLGLYKAKTYNDSRKEKISTSVISLLSGLLSIVFGIVTIVVRSMDPRLLLILSGVVMIVVAFLDMMAIAIPASKKEKAPALVAPEKKEALPEPEKKDAE